MLKLSRLGGSAAVERSSSLAGRNDSIETPFSWDGENRIEAICAVGRFRKGHWRGATLVSMVSGAGRPRPQQRTHVDEDQPRITKEAHARSEIVEDQEGGGKTKAVAQGTAAAAAARARAIDLPVSVVASR